MAHISDKIADDLVDRQIAVLRAAEGMSARILEELQIADDKIQILLRRTGVTQFTRQRLISILNQIRRIAADFTRTAYPQMRNDVSQLAKMVASRTAQDLNDMFNIDVFNPTLSANQLKRLIDDSAIMGGQTLKDFWSRQPALITDSYSQILRTGIISGASKGEMLKEIAESVRLASTRAQIKTMVRSSVMEIANSARLDMYAQNSDLVQGIVWLSTLDSRTSPICRGLDGLKWDLDRNPIGHAIPFPGVTAHPNCRSTQLPLLVSFEQLAKKNKDLAARLDDSMSRGTRASMDGQVPSDLTYNDWLKTKGSAFARDLLGPARFAMWEDGTLTMRDMLSQSGRPLTIEQLKSEIEAPRLTGGMARWRETMEDIEAAGEAYLLEANTLFRSLEPHQRKPILDYVASSGPINAHLRKGLFEDVAPIVAQMQATLSLFPLNTHEMRLWRGAEKSDLSLITGDTNRVSGFFSTSVSRDVGQTFFLSNWQEIGDDAVLFDIRVPPGTARMLFGSETEQELILNHATRLRVVGHRFETIAHDGDPSEIKVLVVELEVVGG